jgi:hypothetical protein
VALALSAGALALPGAAGASAEPVPAPEKAQRRHFAIFNTAPETPPLILTLGLKEWLAKPGVAGHGFNPALAQRAQPPGPRRSIWVVPGRRTIMLAEVAPAGRRPYPKIAGFEQSFTRDAIRHGLGLGVVSSHSVGLVPDGVIGVRLSRDLVAPVGENVFAAPGALESWFGRWRFIHGASATGG